MLVHFVKVYFFSSLQQLKVVTLVIAVVMTCYLYCDDISSRYHVQSGPESGLYHLICLPTKPHICLLFVQTQTPRPAQTQTSQHQNSLQIFNLFKCCQLFCAAVRPCSVQSISLESYYPCNNYKTPEVSKNEPVHIYIDIVFYTSKSRQQTNSPSITN